MNRRTICLVAAAVVFIIASLGYGVKGIDLKAVGLALLTIALM